MVTRTGARIAAEAMAILRAEGADAVTMRRVATAVGVTPMALYRHFPSREALLRALAEQGRRELARDLRGVELPAAVDALVDFALADPKMYALLHSALGGPGPASRDFRSDDSAPLGPVLAAVDEAMHREALRPDDVAEVALSVVALCDGLIRLHQAGRLGLSDPEFRVVCRSAVDRLLRGVGSDDARIAADPVPTQPATGPR